MAIKNLTRIEEEILEKTTPEISFTIADADGVTIPLASLSTLRLTLYTMAENYPTKNNRVNQDVLGVNNVTVSAGGVGNWTLQTADTAIIDPTLDTERMRAEFAYTYGAPVKTGRHVIEMTIVNLKKV